MKSRVISVFVAFSLVAVFLTIPFIIWDRSIQHSANANAEASNSCDSVPANGQVEVTDGCNLDVEVYVAPDQVRFDVQQSENNDRRSTLPQFKDFLSVYLPIGNDTTVKVGQHHIKMVIANTVGAQILLSIADDNNENLNCVLVCETNNSTNHIRTPIMPTTNQCRDDDDCELEPNSWGVTFSELNRLQKVPNLANSTLIINSEYPLVPYQTVDNDTHRRDIVFAASSDERTRPGIYTNQVLYTLIPVL